MKTKNSCVAHSFCKWYPQLKKNSLEAIVLTLPKEVCEYLEDDPFILPIEATRSSISSNTEWHDGTTGEDESDEATENQPTFPIFSQQIQKVIDDFGAVFVKTNWSSPNDATWVAPTKTLKCKSLEEVYLLLKSSSKISQDLNVSKESSLPPCLVLKRWHDIDPCLEFRCFVLKKELVGICQRDISQYYKFIENEKYDIQTDIKSLFFEKIKNSFPLNDYAFDVVRYKKDKVKIIDFGTLDESVKQNKLFTMDELRNITQAPEFRFIAEDMGIQPTTNQHYCIPKEVNELLQVSNEVSMMEAIRKEVEDQSRADNLERDDSGS